MIDREKKWDAAGYQAKYNFVPKYGEDVLNLLDIKNGTRILDIGCGNGILTKKISEMGAIVTGIDRSPEMLELAKTNYPGLDFRLMDAVRLEIKETFDIVFSNAAFHWIADQDGLIKSIAGVLKTNGYLICEFGGSGCCETIHRSLQRAFEKRGLIYRKYFYFPTIGEYAPLLEKQGFRVEFAHLFDRPTKLSGEDGVRNWIEMFTTQSFDGIEEPVKNEIISDAVDNSRSQLYNQEGWFADYVRIRIKARKIL